VVNLISIPFDIIQHPDIHAQQLQNGLLKYEGDSQIASMDRFTRAGMSSRLSDQSRTPLMALQVILEPYTYISHNPGKEIRSHLINAFNIWLDVPEDSLEVIRKVVRMLHNASLL
jgi:hypothetical protein